MAGKMETDKMLAELAAEVMTVTKTIADCTGLSNEMLNAQPSAGKWSLAQVVEHLNTYNRYYIPLMQQTLPTAGTGSGTYKPGWLGDYFTKSMYSEVKTANRVANKMSAMKGHIPDARLDGAKVISEFVVAQSQLSELLMAMKGKDLASVKIPITISRFIKISLGDAARFLVAHQVRHLLQVKNAMQAIGA